MTKSSKYSHKVLELLQNHPQVSVELACSQIGFSEATCRRLFIQLEKEGLVERFWGGVRLPSDAMMRQVSVYQRETANLDVKKSIAKLAAVMVKDGDVVILDGGTTTAQMVPYLASKRIKVITNSILIAKAFDKLRSRTDGPEILVTGGWLFQELGVLTGPETRETIRRYHADSLFISPAGLDENYMTNHHPDIVETEQTMMLQANQMVLLADSSKIGLKHLCKIGATSEADRIIMDQTMESMEFKYRLHDPSAIILI